MTDPTLQRIRDVREAIARRCDYDAHKLGRFYREQQKMRRQASQKRPVTGHQPPAPGENA